jgi:hypothetical protein
MNHIILTPEQRQMYESALRARTRPALTPGHVTQGSLR